MIEAYSGLRYVPDSAWSLNLKGCSPITKFPGGPVDKPVNEAAKRRGVQPSQILLAWVRAKGAVIVT